MTEANRYHADQRTYSDMLAMARQIHPSMDVRLTGPDNEYWEFFMSTQFIEDSSLPAGYEGTAAWDMAQVPDSYGNQLERFRHKNGYDGVPVPAVADRVNLNSERSAFFEKTFDALSKEQGVTFPEEDWGKSDEEQTDAEIDAANERFEKYLSCQRQVSAMTKEQFEEKEVALRKKWPLYF